MTKKISDVSRILTMQRKDLTTVQQFHVSNKLKAVVL